MNNKIEPNNTKYNYTGHYELKEEVDFEYDEYPINEFNYEEFLKEYYKTKSEGKEHEADLYDYAKELDKAVEELNKTNVN